MVNSDILVKLQGMIDLQSKTLIETFNKKTDDIQNSLKTITDNISNNSSKIEAVSEKVNSIDSDHDDVKRRLDQLENNLSPSKTYSEALKSVDKKISYIRATTNNTKAEILKEAKKSRYSPHY